MWQGTNDTTPPRPDSRRDDVEDRIARAKDWLAETDEPYTRQAIQSLILMYEKGYYDDIQS